MAGSHIAIPTILKIGKGTLNNLGKYIAGAGMKNAVVYFGNGLIGTGLPKPKRKSRKRPKQPSVVFLSIHLFRVTRNRASVWLPASLLPAA